MTETNELKPCPCCVSKRIMMFSAPKKRGYKLIDWYFCRCLDCKIRTDEYLDKAGARAAWNRRIAGQWTKETPTEEGLYFVYLNNKRWGIVQKFGSFVAPIQDLKSGMSISSYVEKYSPHWLKITIPPFPTQEDSQ